jgi:hypothetical protein
MKKATVISMIKVIVVFFINKAISIHILRQYREIKDITTSEVADLANKKFYYTAAINVLLSVLLFFSLTRLTTVNKLTVFILCFLSFILNVIIARSHFI